MPHFEGFVNPGGAAMIPKFKLGGDFCAMQLSPKFHHPMFTRSEVITLTHKQTHKPTTNRCRQTV